MLLAPDIKLPTYLHTCVRVCSRVEAPTVAPSWLTLRDVCLMNCNHHAFTQCVSDVINTLVTSHVDNGSACHNVIAYVIVILSVLITDLYIYILDTVAWNHVGIVS